MKLFLLLLFVGGQRGTGAAASCEMNRVLERGPARPSRLSGVIRSTPAQDLENQIRRALPLPPLLRRADTSRRR